MRLLATHALLLQVALTCTLATGLFALSASAQEDAAVEAATTEAVEAVEEVAPGNFESEPRAIGDLPVEGDDPILALPPENALEGVTYPVTQFLLDFLVEPPNAPSIDNIRDTPIRLATAPHADGQGDVWVPAERRDNATTFDLNALPEEGCLHICKGPFEALFNGEGGGLKMEFDPHLPETSCTVRMSWQT